MNDIHNTDTAMAEAFQQVGYDTEALTIHDSQAGDDAEERHCASPTAAVQERARLYGATPERGEFDPREVWDEDDAIGAVGEAFRIMAEGVAPDGTQLADERENLLWGFVNMLDAQVRRLDCATDRLIPAMRDLEQAQDGTEINARELELITDRARNLGDRRDAFEKIRDAAADAYRSQTGEVWRPRHGSHTSRTGHLTSAAIDARDFVRARENAKTNAHLPEGTLIAVAGGRETTDAKAVWAVLDRVKSKHPDIVLAHGGGPGAELFAAKWAESRSVHQVVCKPDWTRHGRAAPFRRNDDLLALMPKGLVAFPRQRHHRQPGRQGAPARDRHFEGMSRTDLTGRAAHWRGSSWLLR